jgi:hypothetical protein
MLNKNCEHCDASYIGRGKRYCGKECQYASRKTGKDPKAAVMRWRKSSKGRAVELKGGKCMICGYDRCVKALEFHHLDPAEKEFQITGKIRSWARIVEELKKCVLLCANCHREVHEGMHETLKNP